MSDLLIRGMEMPKDGFITITVTSDGRVVGNSKKENGKFEYLDNEDIAKAVQVLSHGRLIDADALEKEAQKRMLMCDKNDNQFQKPYEIMRAIVLAPTVIEAEEGQDMSNGFFEYSKQSEGRCDGCRDCRTVHANGGWSFLGCYHEPYHGKWVCEIRNCPFYRKEEGE